MKSDRRIDYAAHSYRKRQRTNDLDCNDSDRDGFFSRLANESSVHQGNNDEDDILAFGYECKIFDDKEKAAKVDNGDYLILWKSIDIDEHRRLKRPLCWMDRYDARHMMEDWILLPQNQGGNGEMVRGKEAATLDPAFDMDRYKDLYYRELYNPDVSEDERDSKKEGAAIHYNYNSDVDREPNEVQRTIEKRYNTSLGMILPENQEQLSIIENVVQEIKRTAKHSADVNMLEIKFQVRSSSNPLYSFLSKYDPLYPFYKHLLELKDELSTKNESTAQAALVDYGSSDSSGESEGEREAEDKALISPPANESIKEVIDKTARFIAKSRQGQQLLQHIKSKNRNNPKFDFLNEASAYHAYFQQQIRNCVRPSAEISES